MYPELRLVRCRWVIAIWAVSFVLAWAGTLAMEYLITPVSGFWESTTMFYFGYAGIAFGLYLACRSHGIRISRMIGPIPPAGKTLGFALTAVPVVLASFGGAWLITLVFPHLFDGFLNEMAKYQPAGTVQMLVVFILFVFIGPVLEELTFRGLLFTRLSVKYSPRTAIILSSLMFGLMHIDLIGAFIFGLVTASLYARSRSLIAPIALHSLNNLIALTGYFFDSSEAAIPSWLGMIGVFVGIPICAYLVARWTRRTMEPPYLAGSMILGNGETRGLTAI